MSKARVAAMGNVLCCGCNDVFFCLVVSLEGPRSSEKEALDLSTGRYKNVYMRAKLPLGISGIKSPMSG